MAFAFIFETVSGGEWLVLLAVVLIVVGPKNLPAMARKVGSVLAQLRRAADEFKRQLMTMDQEIQSTVTPPAPIEIPDESSASQPAADATPDPDGVNGDGPPGDAYDYSSDDPYNPDDYRDDYSEAYGVEPEAEAEKTEGEGGAAGETSSNTVEAAPVRS